MNPIFEIGIQHSAFSIQHSAFSIQHKACPADGEALAPTQG
jgi:hypothetical protein